MNHAQLVRCSVGEACISSVLRGARCSRRRESCSRISDVLAIWYQHDQDIRHLFRRITDLRRRLDTQTSYSLPPCHHRGNHCLVNQQCDGPSSNLHLQTGIEPQIHLHFTSSSLSKFTSHFQLSPEPRSTRSTRFFRYIHIHASDHFPTFILSHEHLLCTTLVSSLGLHLTPRHSSTSPTPRYTNFLLLQLLFANPSDAFPLHQLYIYLTNSSLYPLHSVQSLSAFFLLPRHFTSSAHLSSLSGLIYSNTHSLRSLALPSHHSTYHCYLSLPIYHFTLHQSSTSFRHRFQPSPN